MSQFRAKQYIMWDTMILWDTRVLWDTLVLWDTMILRDTLVFLVLYVFYNPTKANNLKKLHKEFNKPVLLAEVDGKLCPGINILHPVLVPVLGIKERGQPTEQLHLPGNLQTD